MKEYKVVCFMTDCINNNKEIKNNQGNYDRGSCKENKIIIGPIRKRPFCIGYENEEINSPTITIEDLKIIY